MNPSCKVEAVQTVCHIFTGICMDPVGHAEMFLCLILNQVSSTLLKLQLIEVRLENGSL